MRKPAKMNISQLSTSTNTPWNGDMQFIKRTNRTPLVPIPQSGQAQDVAGTKSYPVT